MLTDLEEIHFLELSKVEKFKKDVPITWWLEYLKDPHSSEVQKIGKFDPVIKEAVKMFDTIKADDRTKELIRLREKGERDFNSAIKLSRIEGEKRGERREKKEMAKKLLLMGMTLQDIQAITELSISEIESLK
jgi:predicted transposase/invertase (TIGR01784 family)